MSLLASVSHPAASLGRVSAGWAGTSFRRTFATLKGETTTPLLNVTVGQLIDQTTEKKEFKDVYRSVHQEYRWTWAELKKFVDASAVGLHGTRLKPNKRLAVLLDNDTELIVTALASARVGFLTSFIDPTTPADVVEKQLFNLNPRGVLASIPVARTTITSIIPELPYLDVKSLLKIARLPELRVPLSSGWDVVPGFARLSDTLVRDPMPSPIPRLEAQLTPQNPQYAQEHVFTQSSVINTGYLVGKQLGLNENDRILAAINLNTPTGLGIGVFSSLTHTSTLIVPSSTIDESSIVKAIANEHANVLIIYADTLKQISSNPKFASKLASLQKVLIVHDITRTQTSDSFVSNLKFAENAKISVAHLSPSSGVFLLKEFGSNSVNALPHSELRTSLVKSNGATTDAKDGEVGQLFVRGALSPTGAVTPDAFAPLPNDNWVKTGIQAKIEKGKLIVVEEASA